MRGENGEQPDDITSMRDLSTTKEAMDSEDGITQKLVLGIAQEQEMEVL